MSSINRILLFIVILMLFTGCGVKNDLEQEPEYLGEEPQTEGLDLEEEINDTYTLSSHTYQDNNVQIIYPQVAGLKDTDLQSVINEIIKLDAIRGGLRFYPDTTALTLDVNYEVAFEGKRVLSINFAGYANVEGSAHPASLFYTSNIDLHNGKKIHLDEVVKIDDNLLAKLENGYIGNIDKVESPEFLDYVLTENVPSQLENADHSNGKLNLAYSYFTAKALGLSIPVAHVLGDHVEFELPYDEIRDNLRLDNPILSEFQEE